MPYAATADLIERLVHAVRRGEHITLIVGSGVTAPAVPTVSDMLALADDYAAGRDDKGDLTRALEQARATLDDPVALYVAYRRAFANWVSGTEFDVVAQEAVLQAYQPVDRTRSALATHGVWQRVDARLGERVEADLASWQLPPGMAALGRLLARRPAQFGNRLLTTNFDPLAEIAIRRAGGRATPLTLTEKGAAPPLGLNGDAVRVFHLNGYWRPVRPADRRLLLHDPEKLSPHPPLAVPRSDEPHRWALATGIARLLRGDTICVVGYGGYDDVIYDALRQVGHRVTVVWALDRPDEAAARRQADRLREALGPGREPVVCPGVDSNEFFPELADRLGVPAQPRAAYSERRHRHHDWERALISEPSTEPPLGAMQLIGQLDRRFGWEFSPAADVQTPSLLFWPVRLRDTSSLIHTAQALVAAALSARGVEPIVCLDDLGLAGRERLTANFARDVRRWFARISGATAPTIVSLQDYVDGVDVFTGAPDPALMLRPTRPWAVARELFGERNPSLYSILVATKILPNIPVEQLPEESGTVMQALLSKKANRLLTPLTVWSYLNRLLVERPSASVLTLGGYDERPFWELWRDVFDYGVNQLYNPQAESLTNESLMLRWQNARELADHLRQARSMPDWDGERRYLHWLVQNALLLPVYLTGGPVPTLGPYRLDSWAAALAAVRDDPAHLDTIAQRVSELYLDGE
ncbi:MAG TPA: hypothetical protein VFR67_12785 [Pilimelia sp.]|nr:hypothetical protein [Pilimelia sp.]